MKKLLALALAAAALGACASDPDAIVSTEQAANVDGGRDRLVSMDMSDAHQDGDDEDGDDGDDGRSSTTRPTPTTRPSTVASTTTTAPPAAPLVIESGMTSGVDSISTRYTSVGALITNPNALAAYDVDVVFNLKDAAGNVIDTESESIPYIAPGSQRLASPWMVGFDLPTEPVALEVVAIVEDFAEDKGPEGHPDMWILAEHPLDVVSAGIQRNTFSTEVVGQISNPGREVAEFATVDCVLRAGAVLVGGVQGAVAAPIVPGGTVSFNAYLSYFPTNTDSVECQAHA